MILKRIAKILWRMIPQGIVKTKIHCISYSKNGFSFAFRNGLFYVKGPHGIEMRTLETPFNLVRYYALFCKYYSPGNGDTVVDAGSYNAHVSILFSKLVGPSGKVIAFEPDPGNYSICAENIKLNDCDNITLVDKGLWTEDVVLEFNSNSSKASSVFYEAGDAQKIKVAVTSLDVFFLRHNISKCEFIKMNIEGSEIKALHGAAEVLTKYKPKITVTTDHVIDGKQTTEPVEAILKSYHYKTWTESVKTAKITYAE